MFKGFPKPKSKMSQGEEGGGNEVYLGLPCGRQKAGLLVSYYLNQPCKGRFGTKMN